LTPLLKCGYTWLRTGSMTEGARRVACELQTLAADVKAACAWASQCRTMMAGERLVSFVQGYQIAVAYFVQYGYFSHLVSTLVFSCLVDEISVGTLQEADSHYSGYPHRILCIVALWQGFNMLSNMIFHRFFAHHSFETSRPMRCAMASLATVTAQRGALWWAGVHRKHHQDCDTENDIHSPSVHGFLYAHCGWLLERRNFDIPHIQEFRQAPELLIVEMLGVYLCAAMDIVLMSYFGAVTTGLALGLSLHAEFSINSVCHLEPASPHDAEKCKSKDVWWLGVINGGEGHHGAHHADPGCAKHGRLHWANIDLTYAVILLLERLCLVWNVQHPGKPDTRVWSEESMGTIGSCERDIQLQLVELS